MKPTQKILPPKKPWQPKIPKEPMKFFKVKKIILNYNEICGDEGICLKQIIDKAGLDPEDIYMNVENYDDDLCIEFYINEDIPNEDFVQQYNDYQLKLKIFDAHIKKYDEEYTIYLLALEKYKEEKKLQEKPIKETKIAKLEKELAKLKKEV